MLLPVVPPLTQDPATNLDIIIRYLHTLADALSTPVDPGWTMTHVTPARTMNATTATLPELRQVVATLIDVLTAQGILAP